MVRAKGKGISIEGNDDFTPNPLKHNFVPLSYSRFKYKDLNIPIGFDTKEELTRFKSFMTRNMEPTKWPHTRTMDDMGVREQLAELCNYLGISKFFNSKEDSFRVLTSEFLATYQFHEGSRADPNAYVSFQLVGNYHKLKLTIFARCLELPGPQATSGKRRRRTPKQRQETDEFWKVITWSTSNFNPARAKQSSIRNPSMRYLARIFASSLFPSAETHGNVTAKTLQMLYDVLHRSLLRPYVTDIAFSLADHLRLVSISPPTKTVCVGGVITMLGRLVGFNPANHTPLEGGRKLNMKAVQFFSMVDDVYLAEIVIKRRAIALPNFGRLDLGDRNTWAMPLGEDEYVYNSARDVWEYIDYNLADGEVRYDNVAIVEDLGDDDDEENEENEENEGDDEDDEVEEENNGKRAENQNMELDEELQLREAVKRSRVDFHGLGEGSSRPNMPYMEPQSPAMPPPPPFIYETNEPWHQNVPPQHEQQMRNFPFGNYFDNNYVHPQMQAWNNSQSQILAFLNDEKERNEQRWQRQDQANEALNQQMQNLALQQRNYLDPMYTNSQGYPPTGFDYRRPHFPVPQDFNWDNRVRYPGPDYRPPNPQ